MGMNKANNSSDEFYNNRDMNRYYPESFIEPVTRVGKNSIAEQRKIHSREEERKKRNQQKVYSVQNGREQKDIHKARPKPTTKHSTKPLNQNQYRRE